MTHMMSAIEALTAKQRLAVSRQSLVVTVNEPLWASLARWCIRRCVVQLEQRNLELTRLSATARPNPATNGRTLF